MNKTITTFSLLLLLLLSACSPAITNEPDQPTAPKEINILAIGNSFSENATKYLPHILAEKQDSNIHIYRIGKSGGSLYDVWYNHIHNDNSYYFQGISDTTWNVIEEIKNIDEALNYKKWDIVTIQQASADSGIAESFQPHIRNIVNLIKNKNNETIIAFHKTWSYAKNTWHPGFEKYNKNQDQMDQMISESVKSISTDVDMIIPSGDLIKKLRSKNLAYSNELTQDGFHLDQTIPCYACSILWYEYLISTKNKKHLFPIQNLSLFKGNEDLKIIESSIQELTQNK